ncbi:MAG: tyrosine-protein phosphatase [Bacilli bacterium]|nr:tyrosine-protein phosphatase [Bacilli bacterium]
MASIKLKKVKNIRDLEGIQTSTGRIKKGILYRSSKLTEATAEDIEKLQNKYQIKTIIDLRTPAEIDEKPNQEVPNTNYKKVPIFDRRVPGITHENKRMRIKANINMPEMYESMLKEEFIENTKNVIHTILGLDEKDYPLLYHCTEGKDRTGVVTAILLLILGVNRKDIMKDYMLTNKVNKRKAKIAYFMIKNFDHDLERAELAKAMFIAKEEYLESVFQYIDNNWKSTEDFLKNGLNITEEEIAHFKKIIVEE